MADRNGHTYQKRLTQALFFVLLLLFFAAACYIPALSGFFVLDDFPNFYGLQYVHDFRSAIKYMLEGPGGLRWLAYASFLPHADAWNNENAFPFKLINVLIHFLNGGLLLAALRQLLSQNDFKVRYNTTLLAALAATVWLIHPAHVNTVLYSVQRMTLLAGTFTLLGVLFHLQFAANYSGPLKWGQWLFYSTVIASITALGILGKETAVLLPAFLLLLLHYSHNRNLLTPVQKCLTFATPYILLATYLIIANRLQYGGRDFNLPERLMSQVVIVQQYLFKLLIPNNHSFSLLYDDFEPVRRILDPRFVLASGFWLAAGFLIWRSRNIAPALAFGLLWFLIGHSLESSIIPLELYFDHRNYIPSVGIVFALVVSYGQLLHRVQHHLPRMLLPTLLIGLLITANYLWQLKQETAIWTDKTAFMTAQIKKRPDSLRAKQGYIEYLFEQNRYPEVIRAIEQLHQQYGPQVSHILFQALAACYMQADDNIKHDVIINDLKKLPYDINSDDAMHYLYSAANNNACVSYTHKNVRRYLRALLENPRHRGHYHNYAFLLMHSYIKEEMPARALQASMLLAPEYRSQQYWFTQIRLALAIQDITTAEALLDDMLNADTVKKTLYKDEIDGFTRQIEQLRHEKQPD